MAALGLEWGPEAGQSHVRTGVALSGHASTQSEVGSFSLLWLSLRPDARPHNLQKLKRSSPAILQDIGVNAMREMDAATRSSAKSSGSGVGGGGSVGAAERQQHQQRMAAASRLIQNQQLRVDRLEHFQCWAELARETKVRDAGRGGTMCSGRAVGCCS